MILVVCIDACNGMLFHKRRVSSDRAVSERIVELAQGSPIFMSPYSVGLFPPGTDIAASEDYLDHAGPDQICFAESEGLEQYLSKAQTVILFHWNRLYPSDVKFPRQMLRDPWRLVDVTEFAGHSHDTITQEVYVI